MPVTCLLQKDKVVDVADEAESLVHVFIYGAIRRLQHNLDRSEVHTFVKSYFDGSYFDETKGYSCGPKKELAIRSASLTVNGKPIVFYTNTRKDTHHPLNGVITALLKACQSRFVCWTWAKSRASLSTAQAPSHDGASDAVGAYDKLSQQQFTLIQTREDWRLRQSGVPKMPSNAGGPNPESHAAKQPIVEQPTPEQQQVAERMLTHDFVRDLLCVCLNEAVDRLDWPIDGSDLDEDHLTGYKPQDPDSLKGPNKKLRREFKSIR